MIAIKRLAAVAVIGCTAVAGSGLAVSAASADTNRTTFTIAFDYNAAKPAAQNYGAFLREARRACTTPGVRQLDAHQRDADCVSDAMDAFVRKLGRTDIATIHFDRTGRQIDSSRTLAAR